ncbi:MAG: OsmC family protein [Gemmatimonadales bacterium]
MVPPVAKLVAASWQSRGLVFSGGAVDQPAVTVDGDGSEGPSPVDTLLVALAGCTGSDVVVVLKKKRVDLRALRVEVKGERREQEPRRFVKIDIVYHVHAPGASEQAVRHAIDLSLSKYCSVTHSLNPDIPIGYELVLQA